MPRKNYEYAAHALSGLAALCYLATLAGLILQKPGGLLLREILFAASGGLTVLFLLFLQRCHGRRLEEVRREGAERLSLAQSGADLHMRAVESLAIAIDAKDQTTHGHVRRTQLYALELGKLLNVSAAELEALKAGALLHDVGNLAVPEYILNKPGRLSAAEFEKMKIHTSVGGDIVRRVGFPYPVEDVVRFHHEKWDGTGYPGGLKGESIPLVARIISTVDFYDSVRCDRPYRAGREREESLALLRQLAGKSFDPVVVEMFVKHVDDFDALLSPEDVREQVQPEATHAHAEPNADAEAAAVSHVSTASHVSTVSHGTRDGAEGFRSIARAQREVSALHEMAQSIGSSLNLPDTAALIVAKLRTIVPFDACAIYVLDDKTAKAAPVLAAGDWEEFFSAREISMGAGITGWVLANARAMYQTPPELETAGAPAEVAAQVRDVISSPLLREDGAFGAITLYSRRAAAYTGEHLRLLETVCLHTSGALNNALTYERTRESALTDHLTGLPNARALHLTLEHRLAECRRYEHETVAVLSIDVDDFKSLNEQFGHGVGDRVLAALAKVIRGQLRQMDMLARHTGDEFLAVMPGASVQVASAVAERVRTAVEAQHFNVKTGRQVQLSVSVGTAGHPDDGETADELIRAATLNMRREKNSHAAPVAAVVPIDVFR
jgi:diguanylate cyclase (GGDEF)-like protein/putative nucleotidyltransferase with HDIG domain